MLHALIMAGGRGTRFWPVSRTDTPKQLQAIVGKKTMLAATVDRIRPLVPDPRILIATGRNLAPAVRRGLPDVPGENLIVEPVGRDTAPCIALAAAVLARRDPDAVMVVLPADHVIAKAGVFRKIVRAAAKLAATEDALVTLGIKVLRPETGYGYIEMGAQEGRSGGLPYFRVKAFREKPDAKTARRYMKTGRYSWNSGMFVWSVRAVNERIRRHLPRVFDRCAEIADAGSAAAFTRRMNRVFPTIESISIDYGVMERAERILAFSADIAWSDVGNWNSLEEVLPADKNGNVVIGDLLGVDTKNTIIHAPGKLVAAVGVRDLVVVDTPDALLVCPKDQTQRIREVVAALEKKKRTDLL